MKYLRNGSAIVLTIIVLLMFLALPVLAGKAVAKDVQETSDADGTTTTTSGSPQPFQP